MTIQNADLLEKVRDAMDRLKVGQVQLALSCGYTQSYICKVLKQRVKLTPKMERTLTLWLSNQSTEEVVSDAEIETIIRHLAGARPERKIHIMNILRGLAEMP